MKERIVYTSEDGEMRPASAGDGELRAGKGSEAVSGPDCGVGVASQAVSAFWTISAKLLK